MMKNFVISLVPENMNEVDQYADILTEHGLNVETVHPFGVILGSAEDQDVIEMRLIPGIRSISEDRQIVLAPIDAEIQ